MRVLQVFGILNRGGAETMIMNYYRNIDREKIQFDFVVNFEEEGAYEQEIKALGGRIFRVPRFKGYNIVGYTRAWYKLLKAHSEWQAIHVHNFKVAGIIFPIAKLLGRNKRIVHMHTSNPTYSASRRLGYETTKLLANVSTTHPVACSQEAGECYFGSRDFDVIKNAVDTKLFVFDPKVREQKRAELSLDNKFVIGHVGNMSPVKNHTFIVEVFEEVAKQDPSAHLLLIGAGSMFEQTKQLVKDKGLSERVTLTGSRSDVSQLMMAMDAFIFPSHFEGLPVTIVEAQATGLRILMSDVITPEVIVSDQVTTFALSQGASEWAGKILSYKEEYPREQSYKNIVKSGYDIDDNVRRLEQLYI